MSDTTTDTSIKILIPKKDKNRLSCGKCPSVFKTKKELKDHICKSHTCDQCGQRFAKKCHLVIHLKYIHSSKRFTCEEKGCGKSFISKCSLDQHFLAHIDYKPFRCKLCGKRFKALRYFKTHKRVHETDATFVNASEVDRENESSHSESDEEAHPERKVRVFTCEFCGKHFKRNYNMKRHYSTHVKRYFVCEVCLPVINFETVAEREEHYKTVHLGRPFTCGECNQNFTNKYLMRKHLLTHEKKNAIVEDDSEDWTP